MAIEGKANIDTLLIAAEVIERDHVKGGMCSYLLLLLNFSSFSIERSFIPT